MSNKHRELKKFDSFSGRVGHTRTSSEMGQTLEERTTSGLSKQLVSLSGLDESRIPRALAVGVSISIPGVKDDLIKGKNTDWENCTPLEEVKW